MRRVTTPVSLAILMAALLSSTTPGTLVTAASADPQVGDPRAACSGSWSIEPVPLPDGAGGQLVGVSAPSPTDVWAVGWWADGFVTKSLVEHWDGTSWSIVPAPTHKNVNTNLLAVSALSPADAWAVGYRGTRTLALHWDGGAWQTVRTPESGDPVQQVRSGQGLLRRRRLGGRSVRWSPQHDAGGALGRRRVDRCGYASSRKV